ncbi:hypothetical protein KAU33_09255 [Candidatus Dependentiae bacterium]|nr:hypothetical protein [Candidatus Dependentiae bacterium]
MLTMNKMMGIITSEYHRKILRIPHGNQNPTKRYLTEAELLEIFDGEVFIQEKVDGKLYGYNMPDGRPLEMSVGNILAMEDMTGKNTVHNHVMKYTNLPVTKRIILDQIKVKELSLNKCKIEFYPPVIEHLTYAKVNLKNPTIAQIHAILEAFSQLPSHFGSAVIEGLVLKNYERQLMAKWINEYFEDRLS